MQGAALLVAAIGVVVLDQSTKAVARLKLREGQAIAFGFVVIRNSLNQRLSWSLRWSDAALIAFWLAEFVLLLAAVQFGAVFENSVIAIALGAALGGAGSNVLDRVRHGGVVDLVDLRFWPVFNLADVAIVVGVLTSILLLCVSS